MVSEVKVMAEPNLVKIKVGWAAKGDGWAVHAATREEAIQRFHEAERLHEQIRKQPPVYEVAAN